MKKLNSIMKSSGDKPLKTLLLLLLLCAAGMNKAFSADFSAVCPTGQTLYYNIIDATNHYVEITYPGTSTSNPWGDVTKPTGNISLPSTVTNNSVTYTVTAIGENAFEDCSGLTGSLTIPNTVTEIGDRAFMDCSGFSGTLTLGNSLVSIGNYAFSSCRGFTGNLMIPNSVTFIGEAAFAWCKGFNGTFTLSNNLTTIGDFAFYYLACNGPLTIPNSVTSIGRTAFCYCNGFTGLSLGNSLTTIGEYAFANGNGFTGSLTIPESVTSIGKSAFQNDSGFTKLNFNAVNCGDLTQDAKPFEGCGGTLTIGNTVQRIPAFLLSQCDGFTGPLTIPNSVTSIGLAAFWYCTGFNGPLTLGNSIVTIEGWAFCLCTGLTGSLTIPDSVTTIGELAFSNCISLTGSLIIGNGVTMIDLQGFENCFGFTSITAYPETPPTLGSIGFEGVSSTIPVYVPCGSLADYQAAYGWSCFTNMQCIPETLTVYDGVVTNDHVPAYIYYFDDFARSQFVIPAEDLVEMIGAPITSMTFYAYNMNIPYTTVSPADVYLKEVDYTTISAYESKASATTVYSGYIDILGADNGGTLTMNFSTPYIYQGGNLLVGIENTQDVDYELIYFYGQTASGASISGSNESITETIPAEQQDFIPKTTFGYLPSTCEAKSLPYTYGFEEEDELGCWTMLACEPNTGIISQANHSGGYGFRFYYNTNPPQYLISPEFEENAGVGVSFYYKNEDDYYPETFQVGYSTTTKSPSAFVWGEEVIANDQSIWMLYEDSFPEGTKYVAIKYNSNDQWELFLDDFSFTTSSSTVTQTVSLSAGWNWFSTYIEVEDPITMLQMLETALGENGVAIKSSDVYTENDAEWGWFGDLDDVGIVNEQMYKIQVSASCTLNLQGAPAELAAHPITINPGWNWIGFPSTEAMSLDDAFAGFAQEGDIIRNSDGETPYDAEWGGWFGDFETLEPGQGYMFYSASSGQRLLTFGQHTYVDLGLPSGTLWATCNVGANTPEEFGDYFAWGETQPKEIYHFSTYQFGEQLYINKYYSQDHLTVLLPEDDAATVNWGDDWRMATVEEWQELRDNTTCTWTTRNGVNGLLYTASNGNSIFLPAAGYRYGSSIGGSKSYGQYWTSSLGTDYQYNARKIYFYRSGSSFNYYIYNSYRSYGLSVRAVRSAGKK